MWQQHRSGARVYPHVKLSDEIVAYVRTEDFPNLERAAEAVAARFGVEISPSGLQYARSGRSHTHLNAQYPPVQKAASRYTKNHPAVKLAHHLRQQGRSLNEVATILRERGYQTLKGTQFSASQVKMFLRFFLEAPKPRRPK